MCYIPWISMNIHEFYTGHIFWILWSLEIKRTIPATGGQSSHRWNWITWQEEIWIHSTPRIAHLGTTTRVNFQNHIYHMHRTLNLQPFHFFHLALLHIFKLHILWQRQLVDIQWILARTPPGDRWRLLGVWRWDWTPGDISVSIRKVMISQWI